ncbi:hypothetical protein [Streptomyces sp. H27-C3]|uniref:hypothetical protein n=1 Tax=Streptomyces sp. H27-C3 TaxID=3046305 RepID=UPI0024BACFA4|nr:hypothetical protein [Streptomyces sp. H27-C3]MDJ0461351.1 hypothetical protein [Streptomyces sp. H27-C3]
MAEHDAEPAGREEEREPEETAPAGADAAADPAGKPLDEDSVWAAIVAGYGDEPPDPPGAKPFKSIEDLTLLEGERNSSATDGGADQSGQSGQSEKSLKKDREPEAEPDPEPGRPLGSSVVFAPGVGSPRNYSVAEPADDDPGTSDEGHFVPPEPPPLPSADTTARFAWLAVIGGPLLLLVAVLLQWDMTWWLTLAGVGGFLGGFGTLVGRMAHEDEEGEDDPGRGAVV